MKIKLALFAFVLLGPSTLASRAEQLELPPPPGMDAPLNTPRQIAAAVRANSIDIDDAQQIWPRPEAPGVDDAPNNSNAAPLAALPDLPAGVTPNPNIPTAGQRTAAGSASTQGASAPNPALDPMLDAIRQDAPRRSPLETMLFAQLQQAMPQGSSGYLFENATLPTQLKLPKTNYSVHFDFHLPQRGIGSAPFTGSVIDAAGQLFSRFSGSVSIDRQAMGIQVTRVVARGETLQPSDLQQLGTRLSQLPRGALESTGALIGTTAKAELRPGAWLSGDMVESTDLVKRGQAVTIRLTRGPLEITVPGLTKESGTKGQVIRIENTQSQREVLARVTSPDEVQVVY